MFTNIMNGKIVSKLIIEQFSKRIRLGIQKNNRSPGIAVIVVGEDPVSKIYIRRKRIACKKVGINFFLFNLVKDTTEICIIKLIERLNSDIKIDGIIVQLPLPKNIDSFKVLRKIKLEKDVDGLHPYNIGSLSQVVPKMYSCTVQAIMDLLKYYKIKLYGLNVVIVGASNLVGCPLGLRLLQEGCTVTITQFSTVNLFDHISYADLLIVAVGCPNFIAGKWIKKGSIVIDVGINLLPNGKIIGDVSYSEAIKKASWITPVPGGVGPVTVAELIKNTICAFERIN